MTTYLVQIERVTVYEVDADAEDAAIALVRACAIEAEHRQRIIEAINSCWINGPVLREARETHSARKPLRPIVWLRDPAAEGKDAAT